MTRPKPEKTGDSPIFKNRPDQSFSSTIGPTMYCLSSLQRCKNGRERERKIFADVMKRYLKERGPLKDICMRSIFNRLMLRRKRKEKGERNFVLT